MTKSNFCNHLLLFIWTLIDGTDFTGWNLKTLFSLISLFNQWLQIDDLIKIVIGYDIHRLYPNSDWTTFNGVHCSKRKTKENKSFTFTLHKGRDVFICRVRGVCSLRHMLTAKHVHGPVTMTLSGPVIIIDCCS